MRALRERSREKLNFGAKFETRGDSPRPHKVETRSSPFDASPRNNSNKVAPGHRARFLRSSRWVAQILGDWGLRALIAKERPFRQRYKAIDRRCWYIDRQWSVIKQLSHRRRRKRCLPLTKSLHAQFLHRSCSESRKSIMLADLFQSRILPLLCICYVFTRYICADISNNNYNCDS